MASDTQTTALEESVRTALGTVQDPEIHRPITELGMVKSVGIDEAGAARVAVWLTVSGCPMRETITSRVTEAVAAVPGITSVAGERDAKSPQPRH